MIVCLRRWCFTITCLLPNLQFNTLGEDVCGARGGKGAKCTRHGAKSQHKVRLKFNMREPILEATHFAVDGVGLNVMLRKHDSATQVTEAICSRKNGCAEDERSQLEKGFSDRVNFHEQQTVAKQAFQHVHDAWNTLMQGSAAEARLQLMHAITLFPSSPFILREVAGAMMYDSAIKYIPSPVWGQNGTWSYDKAVPDNGIDVVIQDTFEAWESCFSLRYGPLPKPFEQEESALLAAGASASDFILSMDHPCGGVIGKAKIPEHRLQHDLDLIDFLASNGMIDEDVSVPARAAYHHILQYAPSEDSTLQGHIRTFFYPTEQQWRLLHPFYNRRLYIYPNGKLQTNPLDLERWKPSLERATFTKASAAGEPLSNGDVLVIDNFLSAEALRSMQHYLQLSTIYVQNFHSYLGAKWVATPLLLQIVEEARKVFPDLLCDLIPNAWAFKFDDKLETGVYIHADPAAVNLNLWLTDDNANSNENSGGLVIFDAVAAPDMPFEDYNAVGGKLHHNTKRALDRTKWANVTVPYKQNRAILFDSSRFHTTQEFSFTGGSIKSRRINLTLLFGERGTYCSKKAKKNSRKKQ